MSNAPQSPSPETPEPSKGTPPKPSIERKPKPLFPPLWVWIVAGLLVGAIAWIRVRTVGGDHALVNILTLILGFFTCMVFAYWFYFRSGYTRRVRLFTSGAVVGALCAFFSLFEIYEVSGELIPLIRLRSAPPPDSTLEKPPAAPATEIDLATATGFDFPEFLGRGRRAHVDNVTLDPDWESHPPRPLWQREIGAGWGGFAVVNGYAVTLEQRGDDEFVTCYDVKTGEPIWAHASEGRHSTLMGGTGPRSTPVIDEGRVYTLGALGTLLCLDGGSGEVIWQDDLLARYGVVREEDTTAIAWGRSNSPLVVDDLLVVPAGGPAKGAHVSLAAFNKRTGELVWEAGDRQVSYASPSLLTIDGVRQIVSVNEDNVSGHDPATGRVLWETAWPGHSNADASVSQAMPLGENRLLLSKGYGRGARLIEVTRAADDQTFDVKTIWENSRVLKTKFTNAVVHNGFAYALSDGILECVDLETGERVWKGGRYGHGQILGVGDYLLVQAEAGEVLLVEATPAEFRKLGELPALDGKTWNTLTLYGPYLLVRNSERAEAYELKIAAKNGSGL